MISDIVSNYLISLWWTKTCAEDGYN